MHWINYVRNTKMSIQNLLIEINIKSIGFHIEILQIFISTNIVNFLLIRGICIPITEYESLDPGQGYLNPGLCNEGYGRKRRRFIMLI